MISDEFLDYIKKVENGGKAGWDEDQGLWFPHPSPEGGNDTIGYGHKLLDDEVALADAGLEDARILEMLFQDLEKAERVADSIVCSYYGGEYEELSDNSKCMLIDFAFNIGGGGMKKFPKFVQAVLIDDIETMRQQYKRFYSASDGTKKELKQRNEQFHMLFLS